jgi:hypothetical protein
MPFSIHIKHHTASQLIMQNAIDHFKCGQHVYLNNKTMKIIENFKTIYEDAIQLF